MPAPLLFGASGPVRLEDVPPGRFRDELERLAPASRDRALAQLGKLRIPLNDVRSLHVDRDGRLFYECAPPVATAASASSESMMVRFSAAPVPIATPPARSSRPGASRTIYLDFNGHTISGTAWNDASESRPAVAAYAARPFDSDGNPDVFSEHEQNQIVDVWTRVAEDFAPFEVNVTTVEPAVFTNTTVRVLITRSIDANGIELPSSDAGGVAYVDVFGESDFVSRYSPALVYFDNLSGAALLSSILGDVISHETGHNLSLSHDGTSFLEYHAGHGFDEVSWGPIMGSPVNRQLTQWSKGEYHLANNTQDDLAILAGHLGSIGDDHAADLAAATAMTVNGEGVSATGVIGATAEVDLFRLELPAPSTFSFSAKPLRTVLSGFAGNLDLAVHLLNAEGTLVLAAAPENIPEASGATTLAAGTYFLRVRPTGVGSPLAPNPSGYTIYGSLGQYTITGTVASQLPVITSPLVANATTGRPFSYQITATNNPTSFEVSGLPAGLSLNSTTGLISGTTSAVGTHDVELRSSNAFGHDSKTLRLVVADGPPIVTDQTRGRRVVPVGGGITLDVQVFTPTPATSYQWMHDGRPVPGATSPTLGLEAVTRDRAGAYWLMATNPAGVARSEPVFVVVPIQPTQVRAWGGFMGAQTPTALQGVQAIAAGNHFALALKLDGKITGWGENFRGEASPPAWDDVVAIDAGNGFGVALRGNGTVVAWGANFSGQTNVPAGLSSVVAIAAGEQHVLALKTDGSIVGWGDNFQGQATAPANLGSVVAIEAGSSFSLVLRADGTVRAWGLGEMGQTSVPAGLNSVRAITAGFNHALALRENGTVVAWGQNVYGQTDVPADLASVRHIAAGSAHSVAARADGTVVAWGLDDHEQRLAVPADLNQVIELAAGWYHTLALRDASNETAPVIVSPPQSHGVVVGQQIRLQVGASGPGALTYQWRRNGQPIAGATQSTFIRPAATTQDAGSYDVVVSNYIGGTTSVAAVVTVHPAATITLGTPRRVVVTGAEPLHLSATVQGQGALSYQWTRNGFPIPGATSNTYSLDRAGFDAAGWYQLHVTDDHGVTRGPAVFVMMRYDGTSPPITQVRTHGTTPFQNDLVGVATGRKPTYAIRANGMLLRISATPPEEFFNVSKVASSQSHTVALKADGTVAAWEHASGVPAFVPVPAGLNDIVAVATGDNHALALRSDGTVVGWLLAGSGSNNAGVPAGLTDVVAICAAAEYSLVLKADGTVVSFTSGVPGSSMPPLPAGLADLIAISAGHEHALGLRRDGEVVAWGSNNVGQSTVPAALGPVRQIAAGYPFSLAVRADGSVAAWGNVSAFQFHRPAELTTVMEITAGFQSFGAVRNASADGPPTILVQPEGQSLTEGGRLRLSVAVTGPSPYEYQWRRNGQPITFWTNNPLFEKADVTPADAGEYDVVVSNYVGKRTSTKVVVTVAPLPVLTYPVPLRQIIIPGQGFALQVSASGTGPLTYQWYRKGRLIPGANGPSYTKSSAEYEDTGWYVLRVTDNHGTRKSQPFFVRVAPPVTTLRKEGEDSFSELDTAMPGHLSDIVQVAAGGRHGLALRADGTVVEWGEVRGTPKPADLTDVVQVAAGWYKSYALKSDGTVVVWGEANNLQRPKNAVQIVAENHTFFILTADGTVLSSGWSVPAEVSDVVEIAVGGNSVGVALKNDGSVTTWSQTSAEPAILPSNLPPLSSITAGLYVGLGMRADGSVLGWRLQSGADHWIPPDLGDVRELSQGNLSMALRRDGTVVIWHNLLQNSKFPGFKGAFAVTAHTNSSLYFAICDAAAYNAAPTATLRVSGRRQVGQTANVDVLVGDTDGNFQFANLWVNIPGQGWRAIRADNSLVDSSSLDAANAVTAGAGEHRRTFTYPAAGTYEFRLQSRDALGATSVLATQTIVVSADPPATPGDFDGDGLGDIAWHNTATGSAYMWFMGVVGYASYGGVATLAPDWRLAGTGDFDGDKIADLLWYNTQTGNTYLWSMNGTDYIAVSHVTTMSADWLLAGAGDFNGDGRADIIWRNLVNGNTYIWLMDGPNYIAFGHLVTLGSDWMVAGTGDFNGDGRADIVWRNVVSGDCYVWFMDGVTYTSYAFLTTMPPEWRLYGGIDFDADGNGDLIWHNPISGAIYVWLMDGIDYRHYFYLTSFGPEWRIGN